MEIGYFIYGGKVDKWVYHTIKSYRKFSPDSQILFFTPGLEGKEKLEKFDINFIDIPSESFDGKVALSKIEWLDYLLENSDDVGISNGDKLLCLDLDLVFKDNPFKVFEEADFNMFYTTKKQDLNPTWTKEVNGGVYGFVINDKIKLLIKWWLEQIFKYEEWALGENIYADDIGIDQSRLERADLNNIWLPYVWIRSTNCFNKIIGTDDHNRTPNIYRNKKKFTNKITNFNWGVGQDFLNALHNWFNNELTGVKPPPTNKEINEFKASGYLDSKYVNDPPTFTQFPPPPEINKLKIYDAGYKWNYCLPSITNAGMYTPGAPGFGERFADTGQGNYFLKLISDFKSNPELKTLHVKSALKFYFRDSVNELLESIYE